MAERSLLDAGLQASREYFVRVSAYTEAGGWSAPTVAAFSASPAAQPPSEPRDVRVTVAAATHRFLSHFVRYWPITNVQL